MAPAHNLEIHLCGYLCRVADCICTIARVTVSLRPQQIVDLSSQIAAALLGYLGMPYLLLAPSLQH